MPTQSALGVYAAILSTIVAAIQLLQWWQNRSFICISAVEMFSGSDSHWQIRISNRGSHPVTVLYAAYGVYTRPWLRFERINAESLVSISELIERKDDGMQFEGEPIDGRALSPGDSVRGLVSRHRFDEIAQATDWRKIEFGYKRCVWVEHSQSSEPTYQTINLSPVA